MGDYPEQNKVLLVACCTIPYINKNGLPPHKGLALASYYWSISLFSGLFSATESVGSEGDKKAYNPEETRADCLSTVQIPSLKNICVSPLSLPMLWVSEV